MATPVAAVEIKRSMPRRLPRRVLPGFGLTLGYTMVYLSLLVLIPLSAVFVRSVSGGWGHFWEVVTAPRVLASLRLSFGASLIAEASHRREARNSGGIVEVPLVLGDADEVTNRWIGDPGTAQRGPRQFLRHAQSQEWPNVAAGND